MPKAGRRFWLCAARRCFWGQSCLPRPRLRPPRLVQPAGRACGLPNRGKSPAILLRIAGLFACAGRQSGRVQAGRLPALARLLALYAFLGCHIFFSNRLLTKIRLTSWATTTPPSTTAGNT